MLSRRITVSIYYLKVRKRMNIVEPSTWDLEYFKSQDWETIKGRLEANGDYCPGGSKLFKALELVSPELVRVAIIGQDPYPSARYATGVAFSIPETERVLPPTLANIFAELSRDLHTPTVRCGDLLPWTRQGVLLWNAIPSCKVGVPCSHRWPEWEGLTRELVQKLSKQAVVFVFLGAIAHNFSQYCNSDSQVIRVSHPSPLGADKTNHPFNGSRLFSNINSKLCTLKQQTIDWRLS